MAFSDFNWWSLILLALATWRLAYLISGENGPYNVIKRFREWAPLGGLTSCIYCLSLWIAPLLWLVYPVAPWLVQILAISGLALMLRSYTGVGRGD